jgi:hypothetical protein
MYGYKSELRINLRRGSEATMIYKKVRVNPYIVVTPKDPKPLFSKK